MAKSNITYDYITDFIKGLQPEEKSIIMELEDEAIRTNVPIIPIEVKSFLTTILEMKRPTHILEIGTAIGYSAIVMSQYLNKNGQIITIERNPKMLCRAQENIKKAELDKVIHIEEGSAEDILPTLTEKFDFIFIDAAKGQYQLFFEWAKKLLNNQGIIMADNVLHKGMVAKDRYAIPRRQRTIHKRMRIFLSEMLQDDGYKSSVLPIGDGVAICYKKE